MFCACTERHSLTHTHSHFNTLSQTNTLSHTPIHTHYLSQKHQVGLVSLVWPIFADDKQNMLFFPQKKKMLCIQQKDVVY